jgi:hypothetical protein
MKENDASVKHMEAAAIAWVVKMNEIPYVGVKLIMDRRIGFFPTQEEFIEN